MATLAALAPWLMAAASAAGAAPQAGRYDARLCVAEAGRAAQCGPAEARLLRDGELQVQVSDIVYHLIFGRGSRLIGVITQGSMQLDEFSSPFRWHGDTLEFGDAPHGLHCEVQIGTRRSSSKPPQSSAPH